MKTVLEVAKKMTTKTTTGNERKRSFLFQAKHATYPDSFQA